MRGIGSSPSSPTSKSSEKEKSRLSEPSHSPSPERENSGTFAPKDSLVAGQGHSLIPRKGSTPIASPTDALRPNTPSVGTSMAVRGGRSPLSNRTQSEIDAVRAQRAQRAQGAREVYPSSLPAIERRLQKEADSSGQPLKVHFTKTKQEKAQREAKERRSDIRSNRISDGIDNKHLASENLEKYSGYTMNLAHPHGGNKAYIIAKRTGLTPINAYRKGDQQYALSEAVRSPKHIEERDKIMEKIVRETQAGAPAERKPSTTDRARMDTKHRIDGPSGSTKIRVQWVYPKNKETGTFSDAPHLGTMQPSDTSSGEE